MKKQHIFSGLREFLILWSSQAVSSLGTFSVAFVILLVVIKIPKITSAAEEVNESFLKSCAAGINFLREHSALLRIILFFAFINLIAKMGGYGMLPALILGRTGGDQVSLGIVEASVGIGLLAGSVLVTLMKPAKSRVTVIFFIVGVVGCVSSFICLKNPIYRSLD